MSKANHIDVEIESREKMTIFRPLGEIDLGRAPSLRQQLREVQSKPSHCLIVDLAQVPYMDSSGVATLIEAMQNARKNNTRLILCGLQEKVKSIFEIAKLHMVFTIMSSVDEAQSA